MNSEKGTFNIVQPFIRVNKTFVYKKKKFPIDFGLIKKYSLFFYNKRKEFKSVKDIEIKPENYEICDESIPTFISFCQNQSFQITDSTVFSLHQLSIQYEVPELTKLTEEFIKKSERNTKFQSILSKFQNQFNSNSSEDENFIAVHFFENINNEQLLSLPIPVLYRIINNVNLKFNYLNKFNQNQIVEFLFKCLEKHKREASVLFTNLDFDNGRINIISKLLNKYSKIFDFNMLNSKFLMKTVIDLMNENAELKQENSYKFELIDKLNEKQKEMKNEIRTKEKTIENLLKEKEEMQKLLNDIKESIDADKYYEDRQLGDQVDQLTGLAYSRSSIKNEIEFKQQFGNEFNGIMNYLTKKTGGNIHDNKTIRITSNSIWNDNIRYHPKNLVDFNKNNFYESKNERGGIICFDFKDNLVHLTGYSIRSYNAGENFANMRNWVVEVSNNGNDWMEIDRHSNDSTLNCPNNVASFIVDRQDNDFYRYIRIRQTGYSWSDYPYTNSYYIYIYSIEFFGKILLISTL